jgi:predicted Fe-Mo cluster-binding NifX family protein
VKVVVSSSGPTLDSQVDPRFGRCPYFVVVDPMTMSFEAIENLNAASAQGAGVATAQVIAGKDVEAVLTGNCGPNAYQTLDAAGVKVVVGLSGQVREAVQAYRDGALQAASQPSVASHHGMGGGMSRGMGGSSGRAATIEPVAAASAPGGGDVAGLLREMQKQMADLRQQVEGIRARIDELHKDA